MRRILLIILAAVAVAVFQAGFVTALPAPAASVDLALILVVALVTMFRFGDAYVAALSAGITADALSSLPDGMRSVALLLACTVTVFLFTRVFTHHSWQGNVALHVGAFALSGVALLAARSLRAMFAGFPLVPETVEPWWHVAFAAMGAQLLTVIVVLTAAAALGAGLSHLFYFRPHAR